MDFQITSEQGRYLVEAVRLAMRQTLSGNPKLTIPETADPLLRAPIGVFVSLYEMGNHRLRGCIGRLQTPDPLIKSILETSQSTLADPRFRNNPVTLAELPRLELEISLLSPMEPAPTPLDFDPKRHGIYLFCQGRTGTFLPQVGQQTGWTREHLLTRLCTEKMGLPPNAWRDAAARLLTYEAIVIGPVPFIDPAEPPPQPQQQPQAQQPQQVPQGTFAVGNNTIMIL